MGAVVMADREHERHLDVLAHGHAPEGARDLEAARQAEPRPPPCRHARNVVPVKADGAFLVGERTGEAVDEGALAGAVRADEADALARAEGEVDRAQGGEAAEALGDAGRLDDGGRGHRPRLRRCATKPPMPFGATVMKTTSSTPTMRRFAADEIVTVANCCSEPIRTA